MYVQYILFYPFLWISLTYFYFLGGVIMFSKKKKKPQISPPTNFEHRVHTGFDKREGKFVGLPLQWASIVGNNQILKSTNRPLPLVDPSEITPTEILDLKVSFFLS